MSDYPKLREILKSMVAVPIDERYAVQAKMITSMIPLMVDNLADSELERICAAVIEEQHGTNHSGSRR